MIPYKDILDDLRHQEREVSLLIEVLDFTNFIHIASHNYIAVWQCYTPVKFYTNGKNTKT